MNPELFVSIENVLQKDSLISRLTSVCCLSPVGTLLGALTGALIGQETESGFVRGAAVGAISGAVFSIEVFESSRVLWQSDESGIGCLLYLVSKINHIFVSW